MGDLIYYISSFVLLGILKAWGLDIFYAYSAICIVAFHIQICYDVLANMQTTNPILFKVNINQK